MRFTERLRGMRRAGRDFMGAVFGEQRALSHRELRNMAVGTRSDAKITINESNALSFAAFYAAVRTIAETKASLPVHVFEVQDNGTEQRTALHPVAQLFSTEANPEMTPMVAAETRQGHVLTWGNNFAEIIFDQRTGEPLGYWPLHPSTTDVARNEANELVYVDKSDPQHPRVLDRSRVLHVPGYGGDGICGYSPLRMHAQSLGIGLAEDRFAADFFAEAGGKPAVIVEVDGVLTDQQQADVKNQVLHQWREAGSDGVLVFQKKVRPHVLTMPLVEAQLLEMREFQGKEIACRCFKLPPAAAGYYDAGMSLSDQDVYLEKHTLRPWLVRDEQELNRKLFAQWERGRFRVKHIVDGLLRGDLAQRYEAYRLSLMIGFRTVNEVRALEDLPPVEGGDVLARPASVYGTTLAELPGTAGQESGVAEQGSGVRGQDSEKSDEQRSFADPRLVQLTEQHLRGLFRRVAVAAGRAAADPATFEQRTAQFFEKHLPMVSERLAALGTVDQVLAASIGQRDQLRAIAHEADLPSAVERLAAQWDGEAHQLAEKLLQPTA